MNSLLLRLTRAALAVAVVATGFIIKNAAAITSAATAIHTWALWAAVATADRKTVKAAAVIGDLMTQESAIRRLRAQATDDLAATANAARATRYAVAAELDVIAA